MTLDKDAIKESLTENDIKLIMQDLGSANPKKDNQGNLIFTTVCHGGKKHKLYYYTDSYTFHCYTDCGCNYDIYALVEQVKGISFTQSIRYVAEKTGKRYSTNDIKGNDSNIINDWDFINRYKRKKKIDPNLPVYDETVLDVFLPYPHELWLKENISYEVMKKFNIGFYVKRNAITIPCYDQNKNLIGIRGRFLDEEDVNNGKKYAPLVIQKQLYNFSTMFNLYMLHKTRHAIKRLKKVIFFEAEKSCLKAETIYGDDNFSVAVYGSKISTWQMNTILKLGVEEVFIAFDKYSKKDADSKNRIIAYQKRLVKIAQKFAPYCRVYILWDYDNLLDYSDAPIDKGQKVLEELMKNKIEIKTSDEGEIM